ncbi:MAG TPA: LysR family transcriptional regulator [Flexivirga sp.]|uniref:LysR family transcriptional regulator n=1 Tax=Flexivirga sp. TaxID=1962927 RepID=UPI002CA8903A|nr:LysR family transcriptional regulator [Flexivirga sp.]HWC22346.1 LysR family transcriptional regulator [Flexivirga sp.]
MELRHLSLLRELRDRGSVAAVAATTWRTPSAVSQQLRTAERDLGVRLVEADGRGLRLTDEGRLLADAALDVETALARAQSRLDEFRGQIAGEVRIAALPSAIEYLAPRLLVALRDLPVEVRLDDVDVAEEDFVDMADDYDLVIGHTMRPAAPRRRGLVIHEVVREPLDVVIPQDHRWARRRSIRPDEVIREPWITVPAGYPFRSLLDRIERATGRPADVVQEVRDNRVVEALVAAGVGIALLPRFTTRPHPAVRLLQLRDVDSARRVLVMARRDRAERALVRHVIQQLLTIGRSLTAEASD